MSGPAVDKAMTTVLGCQESYACGGSDEAAFECDECGSLQCARCELELHLQERMRNHDRVRIAPGHVPFCDSCKGDSSCSVSGGRLRAVVRCQGCKINLCLDCQKRTHSGVNKRKHPLTPYPPAKAPQDNSVNAGESQIELLKAELEKEGLDHEAKHRCRYSAQYDNRIYTCKARTNSKTPLNMHLLKYACLTSF
ncbi:FYVE domain-containing protein 1 Double [Collichthys lucidus]|uniref:FYVE domain-containing protein 1 Double n=1 Tax=Collichthys lucidus TaxID=240159 RepID=A0A4U5UM90_COLLU|nr:FYVE domain-containing protein 1 Double [Collichthys lucidus]